MVDVKELRRRVRQVGPSGRGRRIPEDLKAELRTAALGLRAAGHTWASVGEALGISYETARHYCERAEPTALVPVKVVEASAPQLVLSSPSGYRVEGLTLGEAAALLRALS